MKTKRVSVLLGILACTMFALPVTADEAPEKTPETGTVIFYRTRNVKGSAIGLNITGGTDGTIGVLKNGTKIIKTLPVREFTFVVNSPSIAGRDSVTIHVEAGKTYYVKGQTLMGWPAARPKFTLMDEAKGKAESDKIK